MQENLIFHDVLHVRVNLDYLALSICGFPEDSASFCSAENRYFVYKSYEI